MVSAGELVYGKRRALPAHPVHAHPSSRSSHKPSDVVRPSLILFFNTIIRDERHPGVG